MKKYLIISTVGNSYFVENEELSKAIKYYLDNYVDYVNILDNKTYFAICSNNLTIEQIINLANATIQYDDERIAEIYAVDEKIY